MLTPLGCESFYDMGTETKLTTVATQLTTATSSGAVTRATMNPQFVKGEVATTRSFPAGLRVLVVDDDPTCLLILETMLCRCLYRVTKCKRAIEALDILRDKKDGFDLVISDVYMPDMDGFKLLELVGLEMDLPVIMMSANGETSAVMKGIKHGACDYLLKPVRIEELKNIWQHVVRRKKASNIEDRHRSEEYAEYHTSASEGPDLGAKHSKRRSDVKEEEEDADLDNEDPSTSKKPRVVWSVELHQQFVSAVNQLGIDKAVPKRILELMNVKGLTRENVASHLQKFRLYLKRISAHQTGGLGSMFAGSSESTSGVLGGGLGDLCALARGQLSPQVLASTFHLGRLGSNNGMVGMDPSLLLKLAAMQGVNTSALVRPSYGPPLMNTSGGSHLAFSSELDLKHLSPGPQQMATFSQLDKGQAGASNLEQISVAASLGGLGHLVDLDNHLPTNIRNNSPMMQILQQQTGSPMITKVALNASTVRPQILSGDLGAQIPNISSFDPGISHLISGQESSMHGPNFPSFDAFDSLRRTDTMDNKNRHFSHAGHVNSSLPSSTFSTSCHGIDGEIIIPSNNGFLSNPGEAFPQSVQGAVCNSVNVAGGNPGSRLNMGLSNWQGWQNFGLSEELGQTVLNPYQNQSGSSGQALQASKWASEFQGSVDDVSHFKPITTTTPAYTDQSAGETDLKFKEGSFELSVGLKTDNGMILEPYSSSDDLFNSYFKQQQQEVTGFTEGDIAAEGYTLGNMYVK